MDCFELLMRLLTAMRDEEEGIIYNCEESDEVFETLFLSSALDRGVCFFKCCKCIHSMEAPNLERGQEFLPLIE